MPFSFAINDLGTIAILVFLEALLSVDNALVLAIMVRHLPVQLQKKALMYGLWGAFILRIAAIAFASYITKFWWLQLLGALYLLWLPLKHFMSHASGGTEMEGKERSFWGTVIAMDLVDLAFAIDSVLVAVAMVNTARHPDKMWVVMAGAILGILLLRFAASALVKLLEKYPKLEHIAFALIGWAGIKMLFISAHTFEQAYPKAIAFPIHEMPPVVFWGGIFLIIGVGSYLSLRSPVETHKGDAEMIEEAVSEIPVHFSDDEHVEEEQR